MYHLGANRQPHFRRLAVEETIKKLDYCHIRRIDFAHVGVSVCNIL
jgi:hypothetical protein